MRVDPTQVRRLQDRRGGSSVVLRNTDVTEDSGCELEELLRRKELCVVHRG